MGYDNNIILVISQITDKIYDCSTYVNSFADRLLKTPNPTLRAVGSIGDKLWLQ
jgi:hypothetical protein